MHTKTNLARALTIAGSDSGGGAGIQADLKVFTVLGTYGMSVITSITAQNTVGVTQIHNLPPQIVEAQIDAVAADIGVDAVKTGMLATPEIVQAVARSISRNRLVNLVIDPVMISKSGAVLISPQARAAMVDYLFPQALIITPNIPEAEALTGTRIGDIDSMKKAALALVKLGVSSVVVKGGHLDSLSGDACESMDLFYDGTVFQEFKSKRYITKNTHGTGCSFSAAITAYLASGSGLVEAVEKAKNFIAGAIQYSLPLGRGHGPTNPWAGSTGRNRLDKIRHTRGGGPK